MKALFRAIKNRFGLKSKYKENRVALRQVLLFMRQDLVTASLKIVKSSATFHRHQTSVNFVSNQLSLTNETRYNLKELWVNRSHSKYLEREVEMRQYTGLCLILGLIFDERLSFTSPLLSPENRTQKIYHLTQEFLQENKPGKWHSRGNENEAYWFIDVRRAPEEARAARIEFLDRLIKKLK